MKATDLRIGNYIEKYGNLIRVDLGILSKITNGSVVFKPIKLTEEWLLKMGFQFPESEFEGEIIVNKESRFSAIRAKGFYSVGLAGSFGLFLVKVKYVHTLQNLYHSVFGEELTIK